MSGLGEHVIRFGAGSPDGPHGAVFKLWGIDGEIRPDGPSDVYLADRGLGHILKTSLHATGKWRTAYTERAIESGKIVLPEGMDRKVTSWDRPRPVGKGLTAAYHVTCPSSELRTGGTKSSGKDICWIEDPGPGLAVQFCVMLAPATAQTLTLSDPGPNNDQLLDHFRLPNGEHVVLLSRSVPLADNAIRLIRESVGNFTVHGPGGVSPPNPDAPVRGSVFVQGLDGGEGIIDVAIPCTV